MDGMPRFVSEPIEPAPGSFDPRGMAAGGPGLPAAFRWRGVDYAVTASLREWKETGPCRNGSGERYVRRHYFEVEVAPGGVMTLYFERSAAHPKPGGARWFLYTIGGAAEREPAEKR